MGQGKNRQISTVSAATQFLGCSDRTIQRMLDRRQLHSIGEGKQSKLGQEEVERIKPLYNKFGASGLPRYRGGTSGTMWSTKAVAAMIGCTTQTVNNQVRRGSLAGSWSPHQNYVDQARLDDRFPGVVDRFLGSIKSWR